MTNTEIISLAINALRFIRLAKPKNKSVIINENTLANTKLGISCFMTEYLNDLDSNTNSLLVIYAVATAKIQAIVLAIISFIENE